MPKKFRLADVDGTVPAVAILVVVDLDQNCREDKIVFSVDRYTEADYPDPQETAEAVANSIIGDLPGRDHRIVLNERARYLMANRRTRELIGQNAWDSPREYWKDNA